MIYMKMFLLLCTLWVYVTQVHTNLEEHGDLDIDKFISDYVEEVKRTKRWQEHSIHKRSLSDDYLYHVQGADVLVGFKNVFALPPTYPDDLALFSSGSEGRDVSAWFAVALEANQADPWHSRANHLVLYKYLEGSWQEKHRVEVEGGVRLATEQVGEMTCVMVAEQGAEGSSVFMVDGHDKLRFVHRLDTYKPVQLIMWNSEVLETFAAVAISENPPGSLSKYATQSPVYVWLGSHFDVIDMLPTYNPQAITHFNIRSSMFVAVANFQNDFEEKSVSSDIFRYNLTSGKFHIYQKLPTRGALDVKFFCFQGSQSTESFLIFAQSPRPDKEGEKHLSVVYKLSDEEYFVPFQALHHHQDPNVRSWTPVKYIQDGLESLVLLGVGEEGVVSYQYDGWRFRYTGEHKASGNAFGPGAKVLSVVHHGSETLISAANKHSQGYEMNVFTPVFRRQKRVEDRVNMIEQWISRRQGKMAIMEARIERLLEMARATPTVDDPVIELTSDIIFQNVEIDHVETLSTKVGEDDINSAVGDQLWGFSKQLDKTAYKMATIQSQIDQLSVYSKNIYEEDVNMDVARVVCERPCVVGGELKVETLNGQNLPEFLSAVVDTREPVALPEMTFKDLALMEPLETPRINGHPTDSLVDWTAPVELENGLQIDGGVKLEDSLSVRGSLNGMAINPAHDDEDSVITLPTRRIDSLNASELLLADGKLSQVDVKRFSQTALRTDGDQTFTEFQDFNHMEASDVIVYGNMYRSAGPEAAASTEESTTEEPCVGEDCSKKKDPILTREGLATLSGLGQNEIESISLVNGEIIITGDFTIHGTVMIENGSLAAQDVEDVQHNISASRLMKFGIPLNTPIINSHIEFGAGFKADNLTVDTLNGVDLDNLVYPKNTNNKESEEDFEAEKSELMKGENRMSESENISVLNLDSLTAHRISSRNVKLGEKNVEQLVRTRDNGKLFLKNLVVAENLNADKMFVRGRINDFYLEQLLEDTVYDDDKTYVVTGKKNFLNGLEISNLTTSRINGIQVEAETAEDTWKHRLSHAKIIIVDNLTYTGVLDGVSAEEFGQWLLTEGEQTVQGGQVLEQLEAKHAQLSGVIHTSGGPHTINITKLISEAVLLTDNITLGHVVFVDEVVSPEMTVGRLNSLKIPEDLLLSDEGGPHHITAHKHFLGDLSINGHLRPLNLLNSVNLTAFCHAFASLETTLEIIGDAIFTEGEPDISSSVNGRQLIEIMEHVWFREDSVNFSTPVLIYSAAFSRLDTVNINYQNIEDTLSNLISLSKDQEVQGTLYFRSIVIDQQLEAKEAWVSGSVQGVQLSSFIKNVLLDGEDQEIFGVPDFQHLTIDGVLDCKGFVNNLNLSRDVMLVNVPHINMTAPLRLLTLTTARLTVPPGSQVGGVDLEAWHSSATNLSRKNVITGNLVFKGEFNSCCKIRVSGPVNGVMFDEKHLMLADKPQRVMGTKTFSNEADLDIGKLQVNGYFNGFNITKFFEEQVTAAGNRTMGGLTVFTAPLHASKVRLPQLYQGYNLTWLDEMLATRLPWGAFHDQLSRISHMLRLAEKSLAGRVYYLTEMSRVVDLEGGSAVPLISRDSSVVATVKPVGQLSKLSLWHWSAKHNSFVEKPGSGSILQASPVDVKMVHMDNGEMAAYLTHYYKYNSSYTAGLGELLRLQDGRVSAGTVYTGRPGTQLLWFPWRHRSCYLVVGEHCVAYCRTSAGRRFLLSSFPCANVTEATLLTTHQSVHLLTLLPNSLQAWRLEGRQFVSTWSVAQPSPVSVSASSSPRHYVAVANGHREGSAELETIDIYRFNDSTSELELRQRLPCVAPRRLLFTDLPTGESVLYLTSDNPTTPLQVFIYRGILGYELFATERTLPRPTGLHAFTDQHKRHFVIVNSGRKSSILQLHFEGEA